jgi:hypothetical protein
MRSFPVDDDLVAILWEQAKPTPFEQLSFSEALRRVLTGKATQERAQAQPLPKAKNRLPMGNELLAELDALPSAGGEPRGRAPKADLRELVRLGILKEGQELIFVDYKGHPQPKHKATVAGADLAYQRVRYSMSALSSLLLKKEGYIAESVRGPDHWATVEGKRIRELWETVLKQRGEK